NHPQERNRIAQAGMALVRTKYNWTEFAKQVSAICAQLAGKEDPSQTEPAQIELQQPRKQ
ncbi:MAG TPA: hypothetical protein VFP71_07825, partial [Candidatus Angelobacter sp.]|nr:hypothetical protein [Candidatus Angelobacter sp.]